MVLFFSEWSGIEGEMADSLQTGGQQLDRWLLFYYSYYPNDINFILVENDDYWFEKYF